jgi:hypothetical protein
MCLRLKPIDEILIHNSSSIFSLNDVNDQKLNILNFNQIRDNYYTFDMSKICLRIFSF